MFILLSISSASWNYRFVSFTKFRTFSANTSSNKFSAPSFLLSFWDCVDINDNSSILSRRSRRLCSLFSQLIFFPSLLFRLDEFYCSILKFTGFLLSSSFYSIELSLQFFISVIVFSNSVIHLVFSLENFCFLFQETL